MLFGRKLSRFEFLTDKIYKNLEQGEVDLAFAHYNSFEKSFRLIENKEKFQGIYRDIKNMLTLYMDCDDLIKHAFEFTTDEIRERYRRIKELLNNIKRVPNKFKLLLDEKLKESKKIYGYKITNEKFNRLLNDIEALIGEENFDEAKIRVKELEHLERKMRLFINNDDIRIKNLIREIKGHLDFSYEKNVAYSLPASYQIKTKKAKIKELPLLKPKSNIKRRIGFGYEELKEKEYSYFEEDEDPKSWDEINELRESLR